MEVLLAKERILNLIQVWDDKQIESWSLPALLLQLLNDSRTIDEILKQQHSVQYKEYLENYSNVIALVLPTEEPEYSLSMGKYEVTSDDECECDVPIKDEYSLVFTTFSNPLFDCNDDFTSSDDESLSNEDVSMENFKVYSNPLFDDEEIKLLVNDSIFLSENESSNFDHHHDPSFPRPPPKPPDVEFFFDFEPNSGEVISAVKNNIDELNEDECFDPGGIDKTDCDPEEEICLIEKLLYDNSSPRPPKEFISKNSDAAIVSFYPSPIHDDDYDSERDILILEELLRNDSLSLSENESFHFDIPSSPRPHAKPPDDDSGILTIKIVGDISKHDVTMPRLFPTQPTLASNQEKSPHLLSHQGHKVFQLHSECPMMIYGGNTPILDVPFLYFYPLLTNLSMGDWVKLSDPKQALCGRPLCLS
uniref:Reverse transcriptase domain-containing protein n=1 Tax=Tanacetum cinerariifolium TaxID=118510 RepID=A0A699JRM8_TANCI|nr:hypothetical protein [Tanacetum cinerariifolium]